MLKYCTLNDNGNIVGTTDIDFPQEGQAIFDFPEDFDFSRQSNYRIINGKLIERSVTEIETLTRLAERRRSLTTEEVSRMLITQQINTLEVDDNTAVRMMTFYPAFESIVGQTVEQGYKFTYGGKLWRVIQPSLTIQAHYAPGVGTESLYAEINETHEGTLDDPIPYNGNMALTAGLYYYQNHAIYLCNRDTGNPVYHPLVELVGIYVEVY